MANDKLNHGEQRKYYITTRICQSEFIGVHRKDLETENWHYYDANDGGRMHFRKEHMVAVQEDPIRDEDKDAND